jgi:hypothetical protein
MQIDIGFSDIIAPERHDDMIRRPPLGLVRGDHVRTTFAEAAGRWADGANGRRYPTKNGREYIGTRPSTKTIAGIMTQTAKGLPETVGEGEDQQPLRSGVLKTLESIKWYLWHGNCSRLSDT